MISKIRDLILFALLILLLKIAIDRQETSSPHTGQVLYSSIIKPTVPAESAEPYQEQIQQEEFEPIEFSMPLLEDEPIQELNLEPQEDMLSYLETTDQHVATLISRISPTSKESAQLQSMRQRLSMLKKSYERIIATESKDDAIIVQLGLKQEQIEKHLLGIVRLVSRILHIHDGSPDETEQYDSIDQGIKENGALLDRLQNSSISS